MDQIKVCLVDDEKELAEIYGEYLKPAYEVRSFFSAEEALREFDGDYNPDLIVTDIKMPNVTGLEFIDQLRKKQVNKPVILMSGYADKNHALEAIDKEVFGFLEKPFEPGQLMKMLDKATHKFKAEEFREALLGRYIKLSELNTQLLSWYRERYQIAENVLFEANMPLQKNHDEVKRFLARVHSETALETSIEQITKEIDHLNDIYDAVNYANSKRSGH